MSDRDALLRAIIDNPAEDTPRLVFADWLDENADGFPTPAAARSRAAFIRDDVLLSQRDEFDPVRLRWELVEKPAREAEPWIDATLPPGYTHYELSRDPLFRRGFPWAITVLRRGSAPLPADAIPLERVRFRHCGHDGIDMLHTAPWRWRLSAIEFDGRNSLSYAFRRLFRLDSLDRLERMAFLEDAISMVEARELVASPLFRKLTSLTISRAAPSGAVTVAEAIASGGAATGLRELGLISSRTPVASLAVLLDSPAASEFESLSLGGDQMGRPQKLRVVGEAARLAKLRSLDLSSDAPSEAGLEAFLASPLASTLRRLDLSRCGLNRDRAQLLASGAFGGLRVLKLNGNAVGNDGAAALARSPHLAGLLVLELSYSQVGDEGVEAILESPLADALVLLDLTGSPASDETKQLLKARMGDRVRV
jgi:uncharacterized protein (TIGR02996 family)